MQTRHLTTILYLAPTARQVEIPHYGGGGSIPPLNAPLGRRRHEQLNQTLRQTLTVLASSLESRWLETTAHTERVSAYAMRLTLEVAPSLTDDPSLEWGFLLHDVGTIGVQDRIEAAHLGLYSVRRRLQYQVNHKLTDCRIGDQCPGAGRVPRDDVRMLRQRNGDGLAEVFPAGGLQSRGRAAGGRLIAES